MSQADVTRRNPILMCNKCKATYEPYRSATYAGWAPILDEVSCPKCGEKRILYYGTDSSIAKMILSTYGVNKELGERIEKIESQISTLKEIVNAGLTDAKNIMTEALISALNGRIAQHERDYHNMGGRSGR